MNCMSINIRGIGGFGKDSWVNKIKSDCGISFVGIQESMCSNVDANMVAKYWGGYGAEFESVDAVGTSGGILSIWDPKVFCKDKVFKDNNFLCVSGFLVEGQDRLNTVNVYAPQRNGEKRALWARIINLIQSSEGKWIVFGDFNAVREREERKNSQFDPTCARDFNEFLEVAGLREYNMKGMKFTCLTVRRGICKLSRIDRFFVCDSFYNRWPSICVRALKKDLSDHSPVVFSMIDTNFGAKPFRWFDSWLEKPGCEETIRSVLVGWVDSGPSDLNLILKLKKLRAALSSWYHTWSRNEKMEEVSYREEKEAMEILMENKQLEEEEVWVWSECCKCLEEIQIRKNRDLKQKSRVKWASMGDENSSYFHNMVNGRIARNGIPGLLIDGRWISKPNLVKKEVMIFFRNHFKEHVHNRPTLICPGLKIISASDGDALVLPFTKQEVKAAVFECGSNKAPGPDGFNFRFVKRFWDLLEDDFWRIISDFHESGNINPGCASSFITLIPKVKTPLGLKDYRPITLIGMISKVISKLLSNRLKKVMGKIISESQSAFIAERFILDGPLMINELLAWLKKKGRKAFLLKIDFEKAYDNVNWKFLIDILGQMGFPATWCKWIEGILVSARASVLVNGSPTFEFKCEKGLRQGDPLSPFLFLFVMEALSCLLQKAKEIGVLKGMGVMDNEADVTHLFYADDALIMGEWSRENIQSTARILRMFHLCSGLRINISKSNLYGIGTTDLEVDDLMEVLGCRRGSFPFTYLGIKVGANMSRIRNWDSVVEIIKNRLASWKSRCLSIGGRLILIKSVLESLPIYYLSLYKAPKMVIEKIEAIMRKFFWSGSSIERKIPWISWEVITTSKKDGGLGVSNLQHTNEALLLKWSWRFKKEENSLWKRIIMACNGSARRWSFLPCSNSASGNWRAIVKTGDKLLPTGQPLNSLFVGKVGNGNTVSFWCDVWLGDAPLRVSYPSLFRLESDKWVPVSSRLKVVNGVKALEWNWRSVPSTQVELNELFQLLEDLFNFQWIGGSDSWQWKGNSNGSFTVSSAKTVIYNALNTHSTPTINWKVWVPLKCRIMVWRALRDRLPTCTALAKRGVEVQDKTCCLCHSGNETAMHLFTGCTFSFEIWSRIMAWCRLGTFFAFDVSDVIVLSDSQQVSSQQKVVFRGIVYSTLWAIWNERNARIFLHKHRRPAEVLESIKTTSFFWFRHRTRIKELDWIKWCNYPLDVM